MSREKVIKNMGGGIVTIPSDPELIPSQTAQDSLGFISLDGQIELCRGRLLIGAEETSSGYVKGEGWGYKSDGTAIHFRKINTKIQYYNTTTLLWVDIVTGLTSSAEYTFSAYQSSSGTFMFATGIDGVFKMHLASLPSYCTMYSSTDVYRGKSIISANRMFMWDLPTSKTGLYGSWQDAMELTAGNYTQVVAEATAAATSGTLGFKAGDAKRNCFGTVFTITATGEVFTEHQDGVLTGTLGGTGTINYITGAWTLSTSSAGTCTYFWEMSNSKGVTDFTYSTPRVPGEGFIINQSEGGDAIQKVEVQDGKFYSLKGRSVYELSMSITSSTNETFNNQVFRRDIGLPYWRASVSTSKGIIFMNTANLDKPELTILKRNIQGDNLEPVTLGNHFDFSAYTWDMCAMNTFGEFIIFSGRTSNSSVNNRLFLYNVRRDTVDILPYGAKTITSNAGLLYCGDVQTDNVYNILSGFDDDNSTIENYWISNDEKYGTEGLKKVKRLRFKGLITPEQSLQIYLSYDNSAFEQVGTILGNGTYVDMSDSYTIGSQGIGAVPIGGESDTIDGNFYLAEIKLGTPKFRKRTIKLIASGTGYVSINMEDDKNIRLFGGRLPSKYRTKQNVSVDGTLTDQ